MQWPTCQDYNEAVQYPDLCFEDEELRQGTVELTPIGLPKVASGNFASVYRFDCGSRRYGIKCFLRNVYDQHQRYALLSQYTSVTNVPHMVDFEYQLKGICIEGAWYPIVKMDWVEGVGLDQFLRKNWSNKPQIDRVIRQFEELVVGLQKADMAHGDLQHGNIMVKNDALRLVDYDGMYVPLMKGQEASELGHTNYQHPARSSRDFHSKLDDFSAWIIYYSLHFLKLDPSLWQKFEGGDDCLILRKSDFTDPASSRLLLEIARHPVPDIRKHYFALHSLLASGFDEIPRFEPQPSIVATSSAPADSQRTAPAKGGATPGSSSNNVQPSMTPSISDLPPVIVPSKFPSAEMYFRALLTPTRALVDDTLNKCLLCATMGQTSADLEVHATSLTLNTAAIAGKRNVVFRLALIDGTRHYAVKCFLKHEPDRHLRYTAIKRHKMVHCQKYLTQFIYQQQGIRVGDDVLPVVKMLWVDGETLDSYVGRKVRLGDFDAVEALQTQFRQMMRAFADDGIAHGDLEPSNIIVDVNGNLKVVDYDAMYVPGLAHLQACEVGQEGLQHPARNLSNYGPYLDNYSAVVIDHVLACMVANPPEQLQSWNALMQHVKTKSGLKRQSPLTAAPAQKKKSLLGAPGGGAAGGRTTDAELFKPSLEMFKPDPTLLRESKFEAEVTKFSVQLQEMNRYRLDLIPPLWNRSHNPT